jgi:signal transduction histidine kinase
MGRLRTLVAGMVAGGWLASRLSRPRSPRPGDGEFDFLALMSHELKTPVNILLGYLELLADGVPEPIPEPARVQVQQARAAAQRIADVVNDLLTWTRLRAGREHVFAERVEASVIIETACAGVRAQAAARGIRMETDVPADLWVWTDPTRACQALRALASNGVKFTKEGTVRVSAEPDGDYVVFRVRDTGIGIAPEHLESIFEPHWQVEASVRRERGGIGLGLSLARELARRLGGRVTVRSIPGEGSEFKLVLPARLPPGPQEAGR